MSKAFVNPLSQLYINLKFEKYVSLIFTIVKRGSFMTSIFIVYENDDWCHSEVRIASLALVSFSCVCVVSFSFSLFFLIFGGVYY